MQPEIFLSVPICTVLHRKSTTNRAESVKQNNVLCASFFSATFECWANNENGKCLYRVHAMFILYLHSSMYYTSCSAQNIFAKSIH